MKQKAWRLQAQWKWAAPVAALGAMVLAGCGGGGGGGPVGNSNLTPAQVAGTYRQTSISSPSGEVRACPGTLTSIAASCGANDVLTLSGDGTLALAFNGQTVFDGTFTISGNTLTQTSGTTKATFTVTLVGNALTLRETALSSTIDPTITTTQVIRTYQRQAPPPNTLTVAQLAGTYRTTTLAAPSGQAVNCPGTLTDISESCGTNDLVTFNANGTFTSTLAGQQPATGTFTLSGNTITTVLGTQTTTFGVTQNGNILTLRETAFNDTANPTITSNGQIVTITRQ